MLHHGWENIVIWNLSSQYILFEVFRWLEPLTVLLSRTWDFKDKDKDKASSFKEEDKDLMSKDEDKDEDLKIGPWGSSRTRTFLEDNNTGHLQPIVLTPVTLMLQCCVCRCLWRIGLLTKNCLRKCIGNGNGLWVIERSRGRWRHKTLKNQGHHPNRFRAQHLENS